MQNRRQGKKIQSSFLPSLQNTIELRHKYNQRCSNSNHKHFPFLQLNQSARKYIGGICSDEVRLNRSQNKMKRGELNQKVILKRLKLKENRRDHSLDVKCHGNVRKTEGNQELKNIDVKLDINLSVRTVNTNYKPPHRYKTTILVFKTCLLLYGGLGCQKNLTWAKLNFSTMGWELPKPVPGVKPISTNAPCSPIYGHTMVKYKDYAIVFGGSCHDEINQTTILNTTTMAMTQGTRCPYRRKQHAAVVVNDMMLIHGGIQARETKSQLCVYAINFDKWHYISNVNMPALSGHKMAKGKGSKSVYMFGGVNSKGKSTNNMYKIKNINLEGEEIKCDEVECSNPPLPRSFFSFEKLTSNYLVLYGGKQENETTGIYEGVQNGVYNDVHVFNMQKKVWHNVQLNRSLDYRFGMGSTCCNGTVFIYGGSNHSMYADASISLIWISGDKVDPWEPIVGAQLQECSSQEISNKVII